MKRILKFQLNTDALSRGFPQRIVVPHEGVRPLHVHGQDDGGLYMWVETDAVLNVRNDIEPVRSTPVDVLMVFTGDSFVLPPGFKHIATVEDPRRRGIIWHVYVATP